jgi:SET domain-containing protein
MHDAVNSMKEVFISPKIEVRDSQVHGRGVFAREFIKSGEILEACHFFKIELDWNRICNPMKGYVYSFPKPDADTGNLAIVLGWGSIYNHSPAPNNNATWMVDKESGLYVFSAVSDIEAGAEIFINYGSSYNFNQSRNI